MSNISRTVKNILFSKLTPEFIFAFYFNWKNEKDKKVLFPTLDSGVDLLDKIGAGKKEHWKERIQNVLDDPNNKDIPRHEKAGEIDGRLLYMHNGIKIDPLSYYSYPMLQMLMSNKGVHEPQEEKIFQSVLDSLSKIGQKTMLELGAYWSFYSMWFKKTHSDSNCFMVEPDRRNLRYGKRNLKLNKLDGTFIHAGISSKVDKSENITTVDTICAKHNIEFLDILHSDIQGFELEMLHGSKKMFSENKIGYVFISTHSNELHKDCKKLLEDEYNFTLVASANLDESYSWDGILVMKAPFYPGVEQVNIAKRKSISV